MRVAGYPLASAGALAKSRRKLPLRSKELRDAAGLPRIRFHDLRHTHATLLLQEGTHAKIVGERLRHASIAITLDTYQPCAVRHANRGGEKQ